MADHGDNYVRATDGETGEQIGSLGKECGHHCGVITVGHAGSHVAHCSCTQCHGDNMNEVSARFTSQSGGVDPRGIV